MKELKAQFIREAPALYSAAVERQYQQTIDYDAFMRSQVEECIRREEKAKAKAEIKVIQDQAKEEIERLKEEILFQAKESSQLDAQKNIDIGKKEMLIETCDIILKGRYSENENDWLKACTTEQLKKIVQLTQGKKEYRYSDLMREIFSS